MQYKVYKMDDFTWIATPWDLARTIEWYVKNYGDMDDEAVSDIKECDLDTEGMFWTTDDPKDIEPLGDNDEYGASNDGKIGALIRHDGDVYKCISFREALAKSGESTEPYEIAGTEW